MLYGVLQHTAPTALLDAWAAVALDDTLDPAFRALALQMPGQDDMAQTLFDTGHTPDPRAIYDASQTLAHSLAERLAADYDASLVVLDCTGRKL